MPSNLEDQLPQLMKRYLDPVAPTQNIAASAHERLAGHRYPHYRESHFPLAPAISVALLVVLLAGTFAWLHKASQIGTMGGTTPTATQTVPTTATLTNAAPAHSIAHSPTVKGITLYVLDFYTDATRTAIHYDLVGATFASGPNPITYVTDSAGYILVSDIAAGSFSQSNSSGTDEFTDLAPLPPTDLGTTQTLTVAVSKSLVANPTQIAPSDVWQTTFTVAIPAAHVVKALPAPMQAGGVTMQITHVDWSHATRQYDGDAGGVRVVMHLTGLPPNQPFTNFDFATHFTERDGGSDQAGSTIFTLAGSWGKVSSPAIAMILEPFDPRTAYREVSVGPDGAADIQLVFLLTAIPNGGVAVLSLNQLALKYGMESDAAAAHIISGPWTFQIPII